MKLVFVLLAILGALLPMYYFISWFNANSYDLGAMVEAWNVNDATTGLVYDLTVAAVALTVWIIWECVKTRRWRNLVAIPATFCIGVSCGLPLYLWLRMR